MTIQNPCLPTEEQFSQRMKEAYGMLENCSSIEDISALINPVHLYNLIIHMLQHVKKQQYT